MDSLLTESHSKSRLVQATHERAIKSRYPPSSFKPSDEDNDPENTNNTTRHDMVYTERGNNSRHSTALAINSLTQSTTRLNGGSNGGYIPQKELCPIVYDETPSGVENSIFIINMKKNEKHGGSGDSDAGSGIKERDYQEERSGGNRMVLKEKWKDNNNNNVVLNNKRETSSNPYHSKLHLPKSKLTSTLLETKTQTNFPKENQLDTYNNYNDTNNDDDNNPNNTNHVLQSHNKQRRPLPSSSPYINTTNKENLMANITIKPFTLHRTSPKKPLYHEVIMNSYRPRTETRVKASDDANDGHDENDDDDDDAGDNAPNGEEYTTHNPLQPYHHHPQQHQKQQQQPRIGSQTSRQQYEDPKKAQRGVSFDHCSLKKSLTVTSLSREQDPSMSKRQVLYKESRIEGARAGAGGVGTGTGRAGEVGTRAGTGAGAERAEEVGTGAGTRGAGGAGGEDHHFYTLEAKLEADSPVKGLYKDNDQRKRNHTQQDFDDYSPLNEPHALSRKLKTNSSTENLKTWGGVSNAMVASYRAIQNVLHEVKSWSRAKTQVGMATGNRTMESLKQFEYRQDRPEHQQDQLEHRQDHLEHRRDRPERQQDQLEHRKDHLQYRQDRPELRQDHPELRQDHLEYKQAHLKDQHDHREYNQDRPKRRYNYSESREDHLEYSQDHPEHSQDHPVDSSSSKGTFRSSGLHENQRLCHEIIRKIKLGNLDSQKLITVLEEEMSLNVRFARNIRNIIKEQRNRVC